MIADYISTQRRSKLYAAVRNLVKHKLIDGAWTIDGRIKVKLVDKPLCREDVIEKHYPGASDVPEGHGHPS